MPAPRNDLELARAVELCRQVERVQPGTEKAFLALHGVFWKRLYCIVCPGAISTSLAIRAINYCTLNWDDSPNAQVFWLARKRKWEVSFSNLPGLKNQEFDSLDEAVKYASTSLEASLSPKLVTDTNYKAALKQHLVTTRPSLLPPSDVLETLVAEKVIPILHQLQE